MRVAPRASFLLIATLTAFVAAGCSRGDETATPSTCSGEAETYLAALEDAPGAVQLGGETLISECLTGGQSGADLGAAGQAMIEAATELNRRARDDAGGEANVALGFLVGAVERGAQSTGGIHADLQRRLEAAARFQPSGERGSTTFRRAFERGAAAGRRSG